MQLNTDSLAAPILANKRYWRDLHEIILMYMPLPVAKLIPLDEIERCCAEIIAEQARFTEKVLLELHDEKRQRTQYNAASEPRRP